MKKIISLLFSITVSMSAMAQGSFMVEGHVACLDSTVQIRVFKVEGQSGSQVGECSANNGFFKMEIQNLDANLHQYRLLATGEGLPTRTINLWAHNNKYFKIEGNDKNIFNWKIVSDSPEQTEEQKYIEDTKDLLDKSTQNNSALYEVYAKIRNASPEELIKLTEKRKGLEKNRNQIIIDMSDKLIARMNKSAINDVWMFRLREVAEYARYIEGFPYTDKVIAQYNRLSRKEKTCFQAMQVHTLLFPSEKVNVGDKIADADLFDISGNVHHLSDYKGKYILLDLWGSRCRPCIQSLPELKKISDGLNGKLTVVSLTSDNEKMWKKISKAHEMSWLNLSDKKGEDGLFAKYEMEAIPTFVIISPEGTVIDKWMGYKEGTIIEHLEKNGISIHK